jgi:hypothetical protein
VDRKEAIALLKEIAANRALTPTWISLVPLKSGWCELHIKPEGINLDCLRLIVEEHGLALKEVSGLLVVYKEHYCPQGP